MRNIVLFFGLLFGLFFNSCSSKEQKVGPGVTKTVETTLFCTENVPVTSPRWGCDGRKLEGQKITGWTTESTESTKTVPCGFTDADLKSAGYSFTGTEARPSRPVRVEEEDVTESIFASETLPWPIKWLGWLIILAGMLAFLIFLAWMSRELLDRFMNRSIPNQTSTTSHITSVNNPATPVPAPICQGGQCSCQQQNFLQTIMTGGYSLIAPNTATFPKRAGEDLFLESYGSTTPAPTPTPSAPPAPTPPATPAP